MLGSYYNKERSHLGHNFVQNYMEQRMMNIHDVSAASVKTLKEKIIAFFAGAALIMFLPYLHIGILYAKIWVPDKPILDRRNCKCSCFDTVFRGRFENPGQSGYKHIYFNATKQTFMIWIFTTIFVLMAYESIKYLVPLLRRANIRRSMFFLYAINIYPHYYSWWSYFNYYNEDFYNYYTHHMFFALTEIIATCVVLNLCDDRNPIISWKIFIIVGINMVHVFVAGADQFVSHVFFARGPMFMSARDVALMVPDALHILVPLYVLYKHAKTKEIALKNLCYKEELMCLVLFIILGTFFGKLI